jgi:hypothetical protein
MLRGFFCRLSCSVDLAGGLRCYWTERIAFIVASAANAPRRPTLPQGVDRLVAFRSCWPEICFSVRSSQFAVRSSQFVVRSSQFVVRSSQFTVGWSLIPSPLVSQSLSPSVPASHSVRLNSGVAISNAPMPKANRNNTSYSIETNPPSLSRIDWNPWIA